MQTRPQELSASFSPEVRQLFLAMIPAYQDGYANYVYQTTDQDVQKRRIKNLEKGFRKLLLEPSFYIQALSQEEAQELVDTWCEDPPYEAYEVKAHLEAYADGLTDTTSNISHLQVLRNGAFLGYCAITPRETWLEIDFGLQPEAIGKGYGTAFYQAIEDYSREHYDLKTLQVHLAPCHDRAQQFCRKVGFEAADRYHTLDNKEENTVCFQKDLQED